MAHTYTVGRVSVTDYRPNASELPPFTSFSRSSPWGEVQTVEVWSEAVYGVTTASHGGIRVLESALAEMPEEMRNFQSPYAPRGWYEEDCDWIVPVLGMPTLFAEKDLAAALQSFGYNESYYREHGYGA